MSALAIHEAVPHESAAILAILEDARERLSARNIAQWQKPFELSFIEDAIKRGEFFVAAIDTRLAGVFRLLRTDPEIWEDTTDAAYVHTLAIHHDFSGEGLGYRLLNWCETAATQQGCRYLRLDCASANLDLRNYYMS